MAIRSLANSESFRCSRRKLVTFSVLGFGALLFGFIVPSRIWLVLQSYEHSRLFLSTMIGRLAIGAGHYVFAFGLILTLIFDVKAKNYGRTLSYLGGILMGLIAMLFIYAMFAYGGDPEHAY